MRTFLQKMCSYPQLLYYSCGQPELKEYCIRLDHDSLWRAASESQAGHDDAGIQRLLSRSRQVQKFLQISLSVRMVEYTLKTIFRCIIYQVSSSLFIYLFLYFFIYASFVVYNVYVGVPSVFWLLTLVYSYDASTSISTRKQPVNRGGASINASTTRK